jgi:signal transduction histidine kinase/ligand-binding sensor domain-containing protein
MPTLLRAGTLLLTAFALPAMALDPSRPAASYILNTFGPAEGVQTEIVNSILQTRNGFLWVGGNSLGRFDGRDFVSMKFAPAIRLLGLGKAMAEGPDGDLWVATNAQVLRVPQASLAQFGPLPAAAYGFGPGTGATVSSLYAGHDGVVWAGTSIGLYRFDKTSFVPILTGMSVSRIAGTSNGHLLIVTTDGFVEWDGGQIVSHPDLAARLGVPANQIYDVIEDSKGARWYCSLAGVARELGGAIRKFPPYGLNLKPSAYRAYEDPQGNMWINVASHLFRHAGGSLEPVPGAAARCIYGDRDGNLWLGTNGAGLMRLKDRVAQVFTTADGLAGNVVMAVLTDHAGKLWVGSNCGGLARLDGDHFHAFRENDGLTNSCVFSLAEDLNHDLWIGTYGGGVFRFRDGHFTQFLKPVGPIGAFVVRAIIVAQDGSLWMATNIGLRHMRGEHFDSYTKDDGLSDNSVDNVYQDRRGLIWVATPTGVDRWDGTRFVHLGAFANYDSYRVTGEDNSGRVYLSAYLAGSEDPADAGEFVAEGDRLVRVIRDFAPSTMHPTPSALWFCGGGEVIGKAAPDALRQWEHAGDTRRDYARFGPADGLTSGCSSFGFPGFAVTGDGKLWFGLLQGVGMVDVRRLHGDAGKPAIYMEEVTVGRQLRPPGPKLLLSPGTYHLELHFGAIELKSPEKILMQYRMDGVDPEWVDTGPTRSAIYSGFRPGSRKFHVRASNRDGVWDKTGIVYEVNQLPYYYETNFFRAAISAGLILLLAGAYRLRLRWLTAEMNARLDDRVSERTRLARELHDTLLQTIQGSKMVADDGLENATDPVRMHRALERISGWLAQATQEGRAALSSLRTSTTQRNDLAEALERAGQDCALRQSIGFALTLEGGPRDMHPIVRDEVYRIGYEAIRNACSHSRGTQLNVDLSYTRDLVVRVRDNGTGIDLGLIDKGKTGHFGVKGMQERAKRIGAKLRFHSSPAGTEVELTVPGRLTFRDEKSARPGLLGRARHFFRRDRADRGRTRERPRM